MIGSARLMIGSARQRKWVTYFDKGARYRLGGIWMGMFIQIIPESLSEIADFDEMDRWLEDSTQDMVAVTFATPEPMGLNWWGSARVIYFHNEADATMFKMRYPQARFHGTSVC